MCTVVLVRGVVPGAPVVLAANRDEQLARPASGPQILDAELGIVGGRDLEAGGTWLAVCRSGFFVALTNTPDNGTATGRERSRGQVVLQVARAGAQGGVEAARAWLETLEPGSTRPFQLLFGDQDAVWVAYMGTQLTMEAVEPGIHVLPNGRLNSTRFPKVHRIQARLDTVPRELSAMQAALWSVLADDTIPEDAPWWPQLPYPPEVQAALHAVWVRLPGYGTRSSSMVVLPSEGPPEYAFIDGPPSEPPQDQSHLLGLPAILPSWCPRSERDAWRTGRAPQGTVRVRLTTEGTVDAVELDQSGPWPEAELRALLTDRGWDVPLLARWRALVPPSRCRLGLRVRWTASGTTISIRCGDLAQHFESTQAARRVRALAAATHVALPPGLMESGAVDAVALECMAAGRVGMTVERRLPPGTGPAAVPTATIERRRLHPTDGPLVGCRHREAGTSGVAEIEWSGADAQGVQVDAAGAVTGRWVVWNDPAE